MMDVSAASNEEANDRMEEDVVEKIENLKEQALEHNEVPFDELLERVGEEWLSSYDSVEHFETSEEALSKFVERNIVKDGLNKENAKHVSKIHNFETITESVGGGPEIVLLVAQLEKNEGKYNPSESVSKYHDWLEEQYVVPTTDKAIKDRMEEILGDKKFVDLAKKHASSFNKLADLGNVPMELTLSDQDYWGEVSHLASCELRPECDVDVLKHQPGATPEEIDRIRQIDSQINDVSFDLWDVVLPKAHAAWEKVQVSYNLQGKIKLGDCYYDNCEETWNIVTSGEGSINHDSYGIPIEHVERNHYMYFYGRTCDTHTGPEAVINEVEMTPYLAQILQSNLSDDDLEYNRCASVSHYDSSATHPWIVGILVESPGSYYWSNQ